MPRTDDTKVRSIVSDIDEDFDLDGYIETANLVVTNLCEAVYVDFNALTSDTNLEMIERWLAAHLYSSDVSRLMSETIGRARDFIEGKIDLGLKLTHHGQQLMGIDFLGTLASFGKDRRKVKVTWLGRTKAERGIT